MGLFDILRRGTPAASDIWERRDRMSRVEYLLDIRLEHLEAPNEAWDGLTFTQLVERQLAGGEIELAIFNLSSQIADNFEVAVLYWGQGDLAKVEFYLRNTLERHERRRLAAIAHDAPYPPKHHCADAYAKIAAILLDEPLDGAAPLSAFEQGFSPWFDNALLDACRTGEDFNLGAWQAAEDAWLKRRFAKTKLKEYEVYVKALTGGFASDAAMLSAHEAMFTARAGKNYLGGHVEGYTDNTLMIDYLFAAILKRIGWEGTYRHSWPGTAPVGQAAATTQPANGHLAIVAAPLPAADTTTGIIADTRSARRFIDICLGEQRDSWDGTPRDAVRPVREAGRVAKAMKDLGWDRDRAALDLMRAYRMDAILNDSTHIHLADPLGKGHMGLKGWTQLLRDTFGLHPDFIPIAQSEERADWSDPQGAWYVLWKKDRRIYAVQREDWGDPEKATASARPSKELWPSYVSFVAWWAGEHRKFRP